MSYEDPRTGRDRNLGQEGEVSSWSWVAGFIVVLALAVGGFYLFGHRQNVADNGAPPSTAANVPPSQQSSGPGVQGAPGGTSGPAAKTPDSSSTGSSSGTSGTGGNIDAGTQPSQDATGVKGSPGGTNGPAPKSTP